MSSVTLHNADCMDVMKSMGEESIDGIITDPPYGVNYKQNFYDDSTEFIDELMPMWFSEWYRLMKSNSYLFLFVGVKNIEVWISNGKSAGLVFKNIIATRTFNNGSKIQNNFAFVMQPVLLFSKGNGHQFNKVNFFPTSEEWLQDPRNTKKEKYQYQYPNFVLPSVAYGTETFGSNVKKTVHPNAKNEPLCRFFVEISTNKGDVVLDPFMGSGTVGVACANSERRFVGIEQDKKYFESGRVRILNSNPLFSLL